MAVITARCLPNALRVHRGLSRRHHSCSIQASATMKRCGNSPHHLPQLDLCPKVPTRREEWLMSSVLSLPLSPLGGDQIVASPGQSGRESSSCMRPDSWPRLLSGAEKALTPDLWRAHCWYPSLQAEPVYNLQVPPLYPPWALDWLVHPSPTAQQVTNLPALFSMPRRDT